MRHRHRSSYFFLCFTVACAASTVQRPGRPIPIPSLPSPVPLPPSGASWTFSYTPGPLSYQVLRNATIESLDSGSRREISTNVTHESVDLESAGDTIHFTAIVDIFSTVTQGAIGPVQPVQLPVQILGSLVSDSLIFSNDSTTGKCSPVSSALSADLHNLLIRFPSQLSQASRWRDSLELTSCQGMISTTAQIVRTFLVSGETQYEGSPVLVIQRTDTIRAHGEGAQQQHRVTIDANGTGTAMYYLSTRDGRIVRLNSGQDLNLVIGASGSVHRFKQQSKQDFSYRR